MKASKLTILDRAQLLKAARATIRLKHSLAADRELNKVIPEISDQIDLAMAQGKQFTFDTLSLLIGDKT